MAKFTVDGTTYEMLDESMTFAEARAIEQRTGHSFAEISRTSALLERVDVLQAMIWVSMKRSNPTLTFGDLDDVEITSIEWDDEDEVGDEPDPPEADDDLDETSPPDASTT